MVDIARPSRAREKKIRRIIYGGGALAAVLLITLGLSRLKPAAPSVDRATVWVDGLDRRHDVGVRNDRRQLGIVGFVRWERKDSEQPSAPGR